MTITAKVIADSIANDIRLTTLELEYPRFIHSEFMTHRMFSRNSSSSRAIPVVKMLDKVRNDPATPIHWGKNKPGMQADEQLDSLSGIGYWIGAAGCMVDIACDMSNDGYHKQIVNRLLEPFQHIKVIVTATEWDNFFNLRLHKDAQPEMQELARCMKQAMDESTPVELLPGEWHLPYIKEEEWKDDDSEDYFTLEELKKCSVARCARVSYLNHDDTNPSIEDDLKLYDRLLEAGHMSTFEHQSTPMDKVIENDYEMPSFDNGVTHMDRNYNLWSGNFKGWIQYRQIL